MNEEIISRHFLHPAGSPRCQRCSCDRRSTATCCFLFSFLFLSSSTKFGSSGACNDANKKKKSGGRKKKQSREKQSIPKGSLRVRVGVTQSRRTTNREAVYTTLCLNLLTKEKRIVENTKKKEKKKKKSSP